MFEMKVDAINAIYPPHDECFGFVGYLDDTMKNL